MSEEQADSQIEAAEKFVKDLEDNNFSLFKRFRRRYTTGNSFYAWNLSSAATWIQFTFGSKLWAWLAVKAPWFTGVLTKFWAFITTLAASVWAVFVT